jgi:spermidine synthase
LKKILKYLSEDKVWRFIWAIFVFIIFWGIIKNKKRSLNNNSVLIAVMTTGFAEIAFQIVVLLSFQIIYGYVFYKLGLILTSFMIGLVLGSWWIIKIMPHLKKDLNLFIWTQVSICIYPLILPLFFWWLSGNKTEITYWLGSNILFPFLPIVSGFIGGFQFPLANKIYLAKQEDIGRVAGVSYSMDLFGSCLGALLTGAFLVPILGIYKTCVVVAMLNFAALILLLFYQKQLIINGSVEQ